MAVGDIISWDKKPKLTNEQIIRLGGAGATLIQAGNGKWVIKKGGAGGAAKVGEFAGPSSATPVRSSEQEALAANAAAGAAYKPTAQTPPQETPPQDPPAPSAPALPNFNEMDAPALTDIANATLGRDSRKDAATRIYQNAIAENKAQRFLVDDRKDKGLRAADNNAAARGIFNSGIRTLRRTEVGNDADAAHAALTRRDLEAETAKTNEHSFADTEYNQISNSARTASAQRLMDRFTSGGGILTEDERKKALSGIG